MIQAPSKPSKLTTRQDRFCHEYVLGDHHGNAARCYQIAYGKTGAATTAVRVNACRLLQKPHIQRALETLRAQVRTSEKLTPELHMAKLATIRDEAWTKRQFSAAIRAEELRGKAMGFYAKRQVAKPDKLNREEMTHRLRHLLASNPRIRAMVVAEDHAPGG